MSSANPNKTPREFFDRWPAYFGPKAGAADVLWYYAGSSLPVWHPANGCHGVLNYISPPERLNRIYSSLWCRYEDLYDAACKYWEYLLNPEISPYKAVLRGAEILRRDDGKYLAVGLTDMTAPIQLCAGLFMQCRIPQENANKLRSFKFWLDNGFELWESFFLSEHFYRMEDGSLQPIKSTYNHGFSSTQGINPEKVRNSTPTVNNSSWSKGIRVYTPVTSVWNYPSGRKPNVVQSLLKAEAKYTGNFGAAFTKLVSKTGAFPDPGCVSPEEAVTILKERRAEWHV